MNIKIKTKHIVFAVLAILGILAAMQLPVESLAKQTLQWISDLGFVGYGVFVFAYALFTVLFLPGFILTVGAGAIFGLWIGFILVSLGSTLGAALAFLIGRFFARDLVEKKVADSPKFSAIDRAVGKQGWKIVFLSRLSPIFPFNLLNYAYGLTNIRFGHYVLASWIGMVPGTLLYVYIGALAESVARATVADQPRASTLELIFQVVGFIATIAVTIYVTRIARKALQDEMPDVEDQANSSADPVETS